MRSVAAIPAAGLLAGVALGTYLPSLPVHGARAIMAVSFLAAGIAWRQRRAWALLALVGWTFLLGGAVLGASAWSRAWRPPLLGAYESLRSRAGDAELVVVTGRLRTDAAPTPSGVSLSLDVLAIGAPDEASEFSGRRGAPLGGAILTVLGEMGRERMGEWRAGRRVRTPAVLRRPSVYLDPGVADHERQLAARGTRLVGTVKSGALVEVVARGSRTREWLAEARAYCRLAITDAVGRWSPRSAAIVAAIVVGDRTELDEAVERRLQEAGTYHVIAISGGNIAILAGVLIGLFRLAGLLGPPAMIAAAGALVAYAGLVGGGASVDRATCMAVLSLLGRALDQRGPPLNTLAVAAAVLTLASPLSVLDPGFLLTCGATLAILIVVPLVATLEMPRFARAAAGLLAASLASELMLLPIAASVFSRVTVAGLALNFAAIPLMGVAQGAGMALILAWPLSHAVARATGYVAHLGADGLVRSAELMRFAPALTWRVAPPAAWCVVAYYAAGALAGLLWTRPRLRRATVGAAIVAGLWMVAEPWAWPLSRGDGRLRATFVDVGQGDAAFVRLPTGEVLAVDAGGLTGPSTFDVGERVVAPVLRNAGVRRLSDLIVTHGDADHAGGAGALLREFRPRVVWEGVPVPRDEALRALRAGAANGRARWTTVQAGDRLALADAELRVWHPPPPDWERQTVRNDDSIVVELRWREVSIVLTGDIEREAEAALAGVIPPAPLRVVKVPHHGSLTSSTEAFVRMLDADVAVVSVGRGNPYGHPSPIVLDRYSRAGAEIFRTDRDGAITIDSDGRSLSVTTFTGRGVTLD